MFCFRQNLCHIYPSLWYSMIHSKKNYTNENKKPFITFLPQAKIVTVGYCSGLNKRQFSALLSVSRLVEYCPMHQEVTSSIPLQDPCLEACTLGSQLMFLSLSLLLSLKKIMKTYIFLKSSYQNTLLSLREVVAINTNRQ